MSHGERALPPPVAAACLWSRCPLTASSTERWKWDFFCFFKKTNKHKKSHRSSPDISITAEFCIHQRGHEVWCCEQHITVRRDQDRRGGGGGGGGRDRVFFFLFLWKKTSEESSTITSLNPPLIAFIYVSLPPPPPIRDFAISPSHQWKLLHLISTLFSPFNPEFAFYFPHFFFMCRQDAGWKVKM